MMPLLWMLACGDGTPAAVVIPKEPAPLSSEGIPGRSWRRMNVDQVRASIERVTGGFGWVEEQDGEQVELFAALEGTLGKPDYLSATEEDLLPGLLFQKFLEDAASTACHAMMEVEPTRTDRALMVGVVLEDVPPSAKIDEALSAALLHFHGRTVAPGDPGLDPYRALLVEVYSRRGEMAPAWEALCVGLITHPDFYSY